MEQVTTWQDPPEGWDTYRTLQVAATAQGKALDWNGEQYVLFRPGWRYDNSPTLAPLAALITGGGRGRRRRT